MSPHYVGFLNRLYQMKMLDIYIFSRQLISGITFENTTDQRVSSSTKQMMRVAHLDGWLVRNPDEGDHLTNQDGSVRFLNKVVDAIWQRMLPKLHMLDRLSVIQQSLRYIEGVEVDRSQWERTIRAVVALRDDKQAAKDRVVREIARFNAATLVSRLVVEMAVCECPITGGQSAGVLDLQPLMSDAFFMFYLGGCSDAIQKGIMEPEIQIAPNGNVLTHAGFQDEIV